MQVYDLGDNYWGCLCGFVGKIEQPDKAIWDEQQKLAEATGEEIPAWFVCPRCGRIIDAYSLEVIGIKTQGSGASFPENIVDAAFQELFSNAKTRIDRFVTREMNELVRLLRKLRKH